jgi:hypothetical protein
MQRKGRWILGDRDGDRGGIALMHLYVADVDVMFVGYCQLVRIGTALRLPVCICTG